jgi:hypothetical protein
MSNEEIEALPPVVLTRDELQMIQNAEQARIRAETFVAVGGGTAGELVFALDRAAACYSAAATSIAKRRGG